MNKCKVISTPADSSQNLGYFVNDEKNEIFPYRQVVGSLMYLAIGTKPDISYAVGHVSRYLEKPTQSFLNIQTNEQVDIFTKALMKSPHNIFV